MEYRVILENFSRVEKELRALNKRAIRRHLPVLSWVWGKPYQTIESHSHEGAGNLPGAIRSHGDSYKVPVTRIPLILEGEIRFEGWRFIAVLQHLEGENIVRSLPGEVIPTLYRNRGPVCDHCRSSRRRNDTFLLAHETKGVMQVGSSCIRDFLGNDSADKLAGKASMFAEAQTILDEGESEFSGACSGRNGILLDKFLTTVARFIREPGYGWLSKTQVREAGEGISTAERAWRYLTGYDGPRLVPSEEDETLAELSALWGESISDSEIENANGDYLHNLRAIARSGLVDQRSAGLAASMVNAYQRAVGDARKKSLANSLINNSYIGNIDDRVTFGLPQELGKRGKPLKTSPIVLSLEPIVLEHLFGYQTEFGFTTVCLFRTSEGVRLVWKASSSAPSKEDVGKKFSLSGSIRKHKEYQGKNDSSPEKQTVLTHCKAVCLE